MLLHVFQCTEKAFQACLTIDCATSVPQTGDVVTVHVIANVIPKGQNHTCGLSPNYAWVGPLYMGH